MESKATNYELPIVRVQLIRDQPIISERQISNTVDASEVVIELMADSDREMFCVLNLRSDGTPMNVNIALVGTLNSIEINPREIFKSSILSNAAGVILFHNHPSGSVKPTREDYLTTERLVDCGQLLGIPVIDHIIVGGGTNRVYSFVDRDELYKTYEQIKREKNQHER